MEEVEPVEGAKTIVSMQPRASLLGIPTELRLQIYRHVFAGWEEPLKPGVMPLVYFMYDNMYVHESHVGNHEVFSSLVPLLLTCRRIREEVGDFAHPYPETRVSIASFETNSKSARMCSIGAPESMVIWPFVEDLKLFIALQGSSQEKEIVLKRMGRLARVIGNGKHLRKVDVWFEVKEPGVWPSWSREAIEALKLVRVAGKVDVWVGGLNSVLDSLCEAKNSS